MRGHNIMFSLRNKKNYLRTILNIPSYLELWNLLLQGENLFFLPHLENKKFQIFSPRRWQSCWEWNVCFWPILSAKISWVSTYCHQYQVLSLSYSAKWSKSIICSLLKSCCIDHSVRHAHAALHAHTTCSWGHHGSWHCHPTLLVHAHARPWKQNMSGVWTVYNNKQRKHTRPKQHCSQCIICVSIFTSCWDFLSNLAFMKSRQLPVKIQSSR